MKRPARSLRDPPPLPSERTRHIALTLTAGDAVLAVRCLHLIAERCERTSGRLRGLAPELRSRAARLRRIAAAIDVVLQ